MAESGTLFFDPKQEQEIKRRRMIAELLMQQGQQPQGTEMVSGMAVEQSPLAGLARAGSQIAGAWQGSKADELEAEKEKKRQEMFASALGSINGGSPPPPAMAGPPSDVVQLGAPSQLPPAPQMPVEVSPLAAQGGAAPSGMPPFGASGDIDNSKALAPQLAAALRGISPSQPMSPQNFQQAMPAAMGLGGQMPAPSQPAPQQQGGLTRENLLQLYMADPGAAQLLVGLENSKKGSSGIGGATGALADRLIAQGVDPLQALMIAKSGLGAGNVVDPNSGAVAPMAGMTKTLGDRKYAEEYSGAIGKAEGGEVGDAAATLSNLNANMPKLEGLVNELDDLAGKATYSYAGRAVNEVARQTGLPVPDGATARAEYQSKIDNNILPLLRITFGAQFTKAEGDSLKSTLGDVNLSPPERRAVLASFIEQKRAQVQALERQTKGAPASSDDFEAEYNALPSGAVFTGPDGVQRRKP